MRTLLKNLTVHPLLGFVASGLLLGIGHIFPIAWWCSLLGIGLFIHYTWQTKNWRQAALGGLLAWTIKYSFGAAFFWSTYPIDWLPVSLQAFQIPAIGLYWFSAALWLGMAGAVVALIYWFIKKHLHSYIWSWLLIPIVWLLGESLGPVFFSLFTIGPNISLNALFSFGMTGYLMAEHPLFIYGARLGGVYALTIIAALLAVGPFILWRRGFYLLATTALLVIIVTGFFSTTLEAPAKQGTSVAIVGTSFRYDSLDREKNLQGIRQSLAEATEAAMSLEADVTVLPEGLQYFDPTLTPKQAALLFSFQSSGSETILIDSGTLALPSGGTALRALLFDSKNSQAYQVDKQYLVPQGEFLPTLYGLFFKAFGFGDAVSTVAKAVSYRPGPLASQADLPPHVPGVLFCFESVSPLGVWKLMKEREVPFVVHPVSHAWFHSPEVLWHQLDQMLRVQAVWNQVPIVSTGNLAQGKLYVPNGEIKIPTPVLEGEGWTVSLIDL